MISLEHRVEADPIIGKIDLVPRMPLPRSFASNVNRSRPPLQPVVEEEELVENEHEDDILAMLDSKPTQLKRSNSIRPTSAMSLATNEQHSNELLQLNKDIQQSLEHQASNLKRTILDSQNSIVSRISADQVPKKVIESFKESVAQQRVELANLTTIFKTAIKAQETSSTDQRERMSNLESILEDMLAAYERDSMILRKEQEGLLVEKEDILRDRRELEKAEALFEQRRLASNENIEYADAMLKQMKEAEAKLSAEMESLVKLRDFVLQKDAEAEDKLAKAQQLLQQLSDWQSVIGTEHEAVVRLQQEVEKDRIKLSRDRVAMLKSKSSNQNQKQPLSKRKTRVDFMSDLNLTDPEDMRRRLSAVKAQMKSLSGA